MDKGLLNEEVDLTRCELEVAGVREGSIVRELKAWISNTIDWECSSNLSLMSISSYVVHSTKETGNIYYAQMPNPKENAENMKITLSLTNPKLSKGAIAIQIIIIK